MSRRNRIKRKTAIHYFYLYVLLFVNGSALHSYYFTSSAAQIILLCVILLGYIYFRIKLPSQNILLFSMLLIDFLRVGLMNVGGSRIIVLLFFVKNILVAYLVYMIEPEACIKRYCKLVYFFAVISIPFFIATNISPDFVRSLSPIVLKNYLNNSHYYGGLLYVVRRDYSRNVSIFYEPGVYEIVLIVAIFFLLFKPEEFNNKQRKKMFIVFIIALITSQSSTGYINLCVLLITYIFNRRDFSNKKKTVTLLFIFAVMLVIGDYSIRGDNSFIYNTVLTKFFNIFIRYANNSQNLYANASTLGARVASFNIMIECLKKSIFGVGYEYWEILEMRYFASVAIATGFALGNFLASSGIISFSIVEYIIFKPIIGAYKQIKNEILALILIYINISIMQSEIAYSTLVFLVLAYSKHSMGLNMKSNYLLLGSRQNYI